MISNHFCSHENQDQSWTRFTKNSTEAAQALVTRWTARVWHLVPCGGSKRRRDGWRHQNQSASQPMRLTAHEVLSPGRLLTVAALTVSVLLLNRQRKRFGDCCRTYTLQTLTVQTLVRSSQRALICSLVNMTSKPNNMKLARFISCVTDKFWLKIKLKKQRKRNAL